jgi:Mg-chelatase subunit ChlD
MAMLKNVSQPQFKMSTRELADTVMELMDAQDRQWGGEMNFERMHIYYHMKANSGGDELSPQKRDYYKLKALIDDLERQGILMEAETATGFTLTGQALDMLLQYLIARVPRGQGFQGAMDFGKTLVNERKHEIRRYSSGDIFRDISTRHTLKEIARQKKDLSNVSKGDFRVFMKQHRKPQSDIVLCLDTSGSMSSQYKLTYARLAATGLAKAAIENGDRVGMVTFANSGQTTIPLTDKDKDTIVNYIVSLSARGNTNIGDGIKCASQLLLRDRNHNQKYILLITDGQPTAVSQRAFDQLEALKEKDLSEESVILETKKASARGVKVSVIHITDKGEASGEFIKNIVRMGKGKVCRMSSPEDLMTIIH